MKLGLVFALSWLLFPAGAASAQEPCGAASADSSFTLGPTVPGVWSDADATYADAGGCYTVDIKVPSDPPQRGLSRTVRFQAGARVAGPGWKLGADFSVPDIPELCGVYAPWGPEQQYQQTTTIYRRRAGERGFTLLGSKLTFAVWEYTTCRLDLPYWEFQQPQQSARGVDVYRIAVRVKAQKYWRPLRIKAARVPVRSVRRSE